MTGRKKMGPRHVNVSWAVGKFSFLFFSFYSTNQCMRTAFLCRTYSPRGLSLLVFQTWLKLPLGTVVNIQFNTDDLPPILNALTVQKFNGGCLVLEVASHLGENSPYDREKEKRGLKTRRRVLGRR